MKIAALIPAYQPDEKLITLLEELSANTEYSIFVIDDGSKEECAPIFAEAKRFATVLVHEVNRGKGAALKTGISYIMENTDCEGIVTLDSDGQHTVKDTNRTVEALEQNPSALIVGGRLFSGKVPLRSKFGNTVTRGVFKLSTGVSVRDTQTGLRAFSREHMPLMAALKGDRYEYEMNVLLECTEKSIQIVEIPIETIYIEENKSSHFNPLKDSWKIYKLIIKFGAPTLLLFIASSLLSFVIDFLLYALFTNFFKGDRNVWICNILARTISATVNYWLNKLIVFKKKGKTAQTFLAYCLLAVGVLVGNTLLLQVLVNCAHMNPYGAKLLVEFIMFFISWFVQRFLIFKKKKAV